MKSSSETGFLYLISDEFLKDGVMPLEIVQRKIVRLGRKGK